jgi:hypothetical protein
MKITSAIVKDFVRKVAPTVATAIGGPLAGGVVSALSTILLGKPDGTQAELESAIATGQLTGDQMVALRTLEADLIKNEREIGFKYADLEFQETKAYLEDVQSARARQVATNDSVPTWILSCAFIFYLFQFYVFIFASLPTDEFTRALIVRGFGTVDGILIMCVSFFVGSSKGSKESGDTNRRIAESQAASLGKVAEKV